ASEIESGGAGTRHSTQPAPPPGIRSRRQSKQLYAAHRKVPFTQSGRVKHPVDFQGSEGPATTAAVPYYYLPASEEGTSTVLSADAVQDAGTFVPTASDPRREFQ